MRPTDTDIADQITAATRFSEKYTSDGSRLIAMSAFFGGVEWMRDRIVPPEGAGAWFMVGDDGLWHEVTDPESSDEPLIYLAQVKPGNPPPG
jgi:hypothetical protein